MRDTPQGLVNVSEKSWHSPFHSPTVRCAAGRDMYTGTGLVWLSQNHIDERSIKYYEAKEVKTLAELYT